MTRNLDSRGIAEPSAIAIESLTHQEIDGTVLVPLFNHRIYIRDCLEAIAEAWCPGYELLLIDDASRDNGFAEALGVLSDHPDIPTTIMRFETNAGHRLAMEAARLARGRFLVQVDSDDVMMPDRLREIAERFRSDPRCRLVTSNAIKISPEGIAIGLYDTHWDDEIFDDPRPAAEQEGDARWLGATAAYHKDVFTAFPPLDTGLFPYGLDLATPMRALLLGTHHYISRPLVRWRLHAHNHHREAGHYSPHIAVRQRYQAFAMLILAQKLRDACFVQERGCRPDLEVTTLAARAFFFDKFDCWSRLFTESLTAQKEAQGTQIAPAGFMPVIPPIPTLAIGDRLGFTDHEFGGEIARHWDGFYTSESWGTWLHRCAMMTIRLIAEAPATINFLLRSHPFAEAQRVSIQLGASGWTFVVLEPSIEKTIQIAIPNTFVRGTLLSIIIVAHDAAIPRDCSEIMDDRRLGVALLSIGIDRKKTIGVAPSAAALFAAEDSLCNGDAVVFGD